LVFSSQLDQISPSSTYDKIDYKDQVFTGEDLYNAIEGQLAGGFKGGQQFSKDQGYLMIQYKATITPPEAE